MKDFRPARDRDTIEKEIKILLNDDSQDNVPGGAMMRRLTLTKLYIEMAETLNYKKPGGALTGQVVVPDATPKDDVEVSLAPINGWAPGAYMCKCGGCGDKYFGDKRSVRCADCAYAEEGLPVPFIDSALQNKHFFTNP